MIRGVHDHNIIYVSIKIKTCVISRLKLGPINTPLDPFRHITRQLINKHMDQLIVINTLSIVLVIKKIEHVDDVVLDIGPVVGEESEAIVLWLLNEVLELVWFGVVENELLAFFLYLLFGNGFHVLELFLAQNHKCNGLNRLVPHAYVTGVFVVLDLYKLVEILL